MERSDGGLARVSYLPGVQPPSDSSTVSTKSAPPMSAPTRGAPAKGEPANATPAPATSAAALRPVVAPPAAPSFADLYGEASDDVEFEEHGDFDDECARLDDEAAERARDRDPARQTDRAEKVSMHALTRRGQSRRELEKILRSRDLDEDIIAVEIERLERVGLIDDIALAQNLVGILQERKGLGRSGIAAELARRMLAPAAIEYALELVDSGDELSRAREIAVKRAGQLRSYDHQTATRRLSAFLMRRGYSGSTVRAAVEHALPARGGSSTVRFR